MPHKDLEAKRAYQRAYYAKNYPLKKGGYRESNKNYRERARQRFLEYLLTHPCVDCGEADPIVLECDHREMEDKSFDMSTALRQGYSWPKMEAELAKCDVRCANCHKRRTYVQLKGRNRTLDTFPDLQLPSIPTICEGA